MLTSRPDFEWREIQNLIARLIAAYPELSPGAIRALVDQVHADQTGAIRDFVPITVERIARERLRRERRN